MSTARFLTTLLLAVACVLSAGAQRKVTPVKNDEKKPPVPRLHYYDKHGEPLEKPVLFLSELDTVSKAKPGPIYPFINGISVGANFFDGVMKIAGQKYGSYDLWADISLWNWLFPTVEAGLGSASNTPDYSNFTYKSKLAPYFKIGFNYNFLYKSNPDYQFFAGFRVGFSSFKYEINDVTINNNIWGNSDKFNFPVQSASAVWGEFLLGLKVKIAGPFSLGWTARFHTKFKKPKGSYGDPWFIPGYGAKSPLSGSFSVIFTIPVKKGKSRLELKSDSTQMLAGTNLRVQDKPASADSK